jgi:hypothetical protein
MPLMAWMTFFTQNQGVLSAKAAPSRRRPPRGTACATPSRRRSWSPKGTLCRLRGCCVARLRDCAVARLRDCYVARLRDCYFARLRDCCVARLRDYSVARQDCTIKETPTQRHSRRRSWSPKGTCRVRSNQGCVIVALQGCVIFALHGCVIVAMQGCVIVVLLDCVITILKRAWSANFKMVWYLLLRPLRPELDGRPSFSWSNLRKHHQNQHNCTPLQMGKTITKRNICIHMH